HCEPESGTGLRSPVHVIALSSCGRFLPPDRLIRMLGASLDASAAIFRDSDLDAKARRIAGYGSRLCAPDIESLGKRSHIFSYPLGALPGPICARKEDRSGATCGCWNDAGNWTVVFLFPPGALAGQKFPGAP